MEITKKLFKCCAAVKKSEGTFVVSLRIQILRMANRRTHDVASCPGDLKGRNKIFFRETFVVSCKYGELGGQ
jgi:hypothetical protein